MCASFGTCVPKWCNKIAPLALTHIIYCTIFSPLCPVPTPSRPSLYTTEAQVVVVSSTATFILPAGFLFSKHQPLAGGYYGLGKISIEALDFLRWIDLFLHSTMAQLTFSQEHVLHI